MQNPDLHSHSNISDGLLKPAEVASRAHANGVDLWALTDHDEISGIAEARAAAAALNLRFIAGVEISITWANETVHIVGLNIDETNAVLVQGLAATRSGRQQRAHEIAAQLAQAGIADAYAGALQFVGNPDLISRTHFARYLIQLGICSNIREVFRRYLIEGKPGYVAHRWATLADAVHWIVSAGGTAVIAHPGRYDFSEIQQDALITEFKSHGGTAIEVVTGSHSRDQYAEYAQVAQHYGLLASRGSDFHGPAESRVDIGTLPPLPPQLTPVWQTW